MGSRGGNTSTLFQKRYNLAQSFAGDRRQGNNWFAAFRQGSTPHKIHLLTHIRILAGSNSVGAYLPGYVNLDSTVYVRHFGVLSNNGGVVRVAGLLHDYGRIVVDKIVHSLAAHHKTRYETVVPLCVHP